MAGESDKAAAALKTALELQPDSGRAYQMLGDIYARAEETDQAVLHYRKALEIEPANVRMRLALGEVLEQAKRPQESLAEADAVLAADPANRFALDLKGDRCATSAASTRRWPSPTRWRRRIRRTRRPPT